MTGSDDGKLIEPDGGVDAAEPPRPIDRGAPTPADVRGNGQGRAAVDEKQAFLLEAVRRGPILNALRSGPASATALAESVEQSRSTIHRATTTLEEQNLIEKSTGAYELTCLGRIVSKRTAGFGEVVWTAMAMEPFLNSVGMHDVPVEHFTDARITRPTPRQPHTSIQRIIDLIERSEDLRMLSTVLSPLYVNVGYREMMDGMEIEAVFDRECIEIMVTDYAREAYETVSTGNFDVHVHDGLPFELFVLDDRIGMAAHDENGVAKVFVECDDPAAVNWGIDTYEKHRSEAEPLHLSDL